MNLRLRAEWRRLRHAFDRLDRQTLFVLVASAVVVILQFNLGDRRFFLREMGAFVPPEWRGVLAWGWWFGVQGVMGFVLPAACLLLIFRRRPSEIGLGLGDWRLASGLALAYLPLVVLGTWFLSADPAFQQQYPHYHPATRDWRFFFVYEALFLFYWIGWEYLWRGFVLFGTAHTFGLYAIVVQTVPFAVLHVQKPPAEALLSVLGGLALGALVWRCRAFWIAIPIHAAQMLILDTWCTLRIRTGINDVGLEALLQIVRRMGG